MCFCYEDHIPQIDSCLLKAWSDNMKQHSQGPNRFYCFFCGAMEQRLPENDKQISSLCVVMPLPTMALGKSFSESTYPSCDTEERKATNWAEFVLGVTDIQV